jgi:sulfite reductase alpha subunit-like flavoprotein
LLYRYEPGDHLGVYPQNDLETVKQLAKRLEVDLDQIIAIYPTEGSPSIQNTAIVGPCTLRAALLQFYDIFTPPRYQSNSFIQTSPPLCTLYYILLILVPENQF